MKKGLVTGIASVALTAMLGGGVYAATSVTDTVSITVNSSASLTASRTNGNGSWSSNTCSITKSVSSVEYNICKTTLTIVSNYAAGYKVTVATYSLTSSESKTLNYNTTYSSSSSGWAVANGSTSSATKYANGGTITSSNGGQTSGTSVDVYYGVGISGTQPKGTYTRSGGAAVYTLAAYS